jgi:signal transduction histidine kinase
VHRLAGVRVRITLAAVLVVGLALAGSAVWLVVTHRDGLLKDAKTAARLRERDIESAISDGEFTKVVAAPHGDESIAQVVDQNGNVVAASSNVIGVARISELEPAAGVYRYETIRPPFGHAKLSVVAHRVNTPSGTYVVYVARSLASIDRSTDRLERLLLTGLPILLLIVGVITWIVTGRALHPVEAMRAEVEAIGAADLHRRVPEPATHDEIARLARTMNAMLGRLENATERQQRFVADASHELRSPLAGIRAQLEVDLAYPDAADWKATERDVLEGAIAMQRLVEDLLTLATVDEQRSGGARRHDTVDLDEIVLTEADRVRRCTTHVIDTSHVSGAQLDGDPDQLTRAVRNLLDNAARHATSTVTVALAEADGTVTLIVADDGPGVPEADRARIFERFARLDEGRARDAGGAGLGLAITQQVAVAHGGQVTVDDGPGARFTVSLPVFRSGTEPATPSV